MAGEVGMGPRGKHNYEKLISGKFVDFCEFKVRTKFSRLAGTFFAHTGAIGLGVASGVCSTLRNHYSYRVFAHSVLCRLVACAYDRPILGDKMLERRRHGAIAFASDGLVWCRLLLSASDFCNLGWHQGPEEPWADDNELVASLGYNCAWIASCAYACVAWARNELLRNCHNFFGGHGVSPDDALALGCGARIG